MGHRQRRVALRGRGPRGERLGTGLVVGVLALAAGDVAAARSQVSTMAGTAGEGFLLPEQVWDGADLPEKKLRRTAAGKRAPALTFLILQKPDLENFLLLLKTWEKLMMLF